ncbi:hypothetical protein ScPMuIL_002729 [Solemya velum]
MSLSCFYRFCQALFEMFMGRRFARSRSLERRALAERSSNLRIVLPVEVEDVDAHEVSCIDLTSEGNHGGEDFIDLTSPGVANRSVLALTPRQRTSRHGRPGTRRRNRRRDGQSQPARRRSESENEDLPDLTPVRLGRSSPDITSLLDSDEDLPALNIGGTSYVPTPVASPPPGNKLPCVFG